jgi:hypothetical protein
MTKTLAAALVLSLCLPALPALAAGGGDDEVIPYDDDTGVPVKREDRKKKKNVDQLREEDEEAAERETNTLTHLDDPNYGVGGSVFAGVMLLESSRGAGVEPHFMFGVRFTWEWSRLIPDEVLREMFFADFAWQFAGTHDGTTEVNTDSTFHSFTVAPAIALPFSPGSPVAAYAQLGAGFNLDFETLHIDKTATTLTGSKFLFQYGIGLRARPAVVDDKTVRLELRVELTRFLRGYMSDTFIGGSIGAVF